MWNNDSNFKLVVYKLAIADNYEWVEVAEGSDRESTPLKVSSKIISKLTHEKSLTVNRSSALNAQMNIRFGHNLAADNSDDDDWDPKEEDLCDANKNTEDPTTLALGFR